MAIAIILLRGKTGTKPDIVKTLDLLRLTRINHTVVLADSKKYERMLHMVKDYITWGEISKEMLTAMVEKRGRLPGNKKVDPTKVFSIVSAIEKGEKTEIKPVFRLHPPRKGLKDKKAKYPEGDLGYRGKAIDDIIKRMI